MDKQSYPYITIKVVGHQWYWSYEVCYKFISAWFIQFDSYALSDIDLSLLNPFRLLEVDERVYLPCLVSIRVLITSSDVLHSWAVEFIKGAIPV
jgi:cytochrome c oxidase subunit 2